MTVPKSHFLLVEDNRAHAKLVTLALNKHESIAVEHVEDGAHALDYLYRRNGYQDRPRPDLVLLDLKMPGVDGFEVLRQVKENPNLRSIPIIVLTTSVADVDRTKAYELHANSYLVKPMEYSQFGQMIEDLRLYWCDWNQKAPADEESGRT